MLNGTHCPACRSSEIREIDAVAHDGPAADFHVLECPACEIAWQWPLLQQEADSVAVFDGMYGAESGYADPGASEGRAALQASILTLLHEPGTVLDIGSGAGFFVRAARKLGWDSTGVDPAATPFDDGGARTIRGDLASIDERFDAVTLFDVVEHVENYEALLAAAGERLKPGGVLLVETGNFQSLDRLRGGATWWDYQIEHRWYLSPPCLIRQLRELGFENPTLIQQTARPNWKREANEPTGAIPAIKRSAKHLSLAPLRKRAAEKEAADRWPGWYFLPIFLVAAGR